ncbi:hypothetical protein SLEP1_g54112 [Rubroshorea leprosula]|uniref:Uncharacterized protein n=1 Tax=Rubroshorea leprosula TaxID=152421 RepID=A0AAV5MCI6_9ROSI|nr:hypothetical protein SLEP1_g54112 [Rubroshorea leprosula]
MTTEVAVAIDERVEEMREMREPYVKALENDGKNIKTLYQTEHCTLFYPLTPCGDTVFHIAAHMGSKDLLGDLLEVAIDRECEVFTKKNSHGNTLLHEVVTSNKLEAVQFLFKKIAHEERASMLMDRNNLGETALYRAAAFGDKATVEYLVEEVERQNGNLKDDHFTRTSDGLSILHIAIMNEKFAISLLKKDSELATKKCSGKTCLHIVASMPTAFKSSSSIMYGLEIIYRYIPDDLVYRDEIEQDVPSQSSKSSIRCPTMIKNIRWNFIKEIGKTKRKHRFAVKLAKTLVKMDSCSWREHYNEEGHNDIVCFSGDEETGEPSSQVICVGTTAKMLAVLPLLHPILLHYWQTLLPLFFSGIGDLLPFICDFFIPSLSLDLFGSSLSTLALPFNKTQYPTLFLIWLSLHFGILSPLPLSFSTAVGAKPSSPLVPHSLPIEP